MNLFRSSLLFTLLITCVFGFQSCSSSGNKSSSQSENSGIISLVSDEGVSVNGPVVIEFSEEVENTSVDVSDVIQLSPSFKFKSKWIGKQQLILTPTEKLKPSKKYRVDVDLEKLFPIREDLDEYSFEFRTIRPSYKIKVDNLESNPSNALLMNCKGVITFNDEVNASKVEKMLDIDLDDDYKITWKHNHLKHYFQIENIKRGKEEASMVVSWDGDPLDIDKRGKVALSIPAVGDFKYQAINIVSSESPVITVSFSEPLDSKQNLNGLFTMKGCKLGATITGNKAVLYPEQMLVGQHALKISSSIRSNTGKHLGRNITLSVQFTASDPRFSFEGEGNILPNADGFILPFSSVNLDAVDIRIIRIFQKNVPFFLQNNKITSTYGTPKRFGRVVYQGKMKLEDVEVNKWKAFAINIPDIIDVKPNEIYQVVVGMRPNYSIYPCENLQDLRNLKLKEPKDNRYWDDEKVWDENDFYEENSLYDWRNRDNPSYAAYYSPSRSISKYVVSSNIGIIAKKEEGNVYHIATSDLVSSAPVGGVELKLLDLQNQVISTAKSDKKGLAVLRTDHPAQLILAQKGDDWGFLKVSNYDVQIISSFDVSGQVSKNEVNAYIYGERDVWRPGDSLFVTTIIKDEMKYLGNDYPVIFELYDTKGVLKDKKVVKKHSNMISYKTKTKDNDPTGNWTLKVKLGGNTFSKVIRIETIRPNRMKIQWVNSPKTLKLTKDLTAKMNAKWLHGLPADEKRMVVEARIRHKNASFGEYPQYQFNNEVDPVNSSYFRLWEGKTNRDGDAEVKLDFKRHDFKEPIVSVDFETRVFEDGGSFSISQFTKELYPFEKFVGFRITGIQSYRDYYDTGKDITCDFVVLNPKLQKVDSKIEYKLYKVGYSWWWDAASVSSLASYVSGRNYSAYREGSVRTRNGRAKFDFKVRDSDWGRYLMVAELPNGNTVSKVFFCDWPGGGNKNKGGESCLNLNIKKDKLETGENIEVLFPSEKGGHALVSLEKGGVVLRQMWVETTDKQTTLSIPTDGTMSPNIYVYVTYVQPYQTTKNNHPIRLYGVSRVKVENPESHLHPEIICKDEVRAKKKFKVKIKEKNGKEIDYTLAIVDEGLLGITNFRTPSPWTFFNRHNALRVKTWDMYDDVLGMYAGKLGKLIPVGGDGMLNDPSKQKAKRFKPVVMFAGPFHLDKGDTDVRTFQLPAYTGEVRVMVVAATESSYGSQQKDVKVVDPLMVLADAPRTLDLNEKFTLPVTIFANKKVKGDVHVNVTSTGAIKLVGEKSMSVDMDGQSEKDVYFQLKSGSSEGVSKITVNAKSGSYRASYTIDMNVSNSNLVKYETILKLLEPGKSFSYDYNIGDNENGKLLSVNASSMIACNLDKRMDELIVYPHGCLEQTVSSVFPQLLMLKNKNISFEDREEMELNVQKGLKRLLLFQQYDGSFSYWPRGSYRYSWASCYAGHFMIMAKKAGFFIPGNMLDRWVRYQMRVANRWDDDYENRVVQAYRLFTLALAGEAPLGVMNRMRENDPNTVSSWLLASAYAQIGRDDVAEELTDFRDLSVVTSEKGWSSNSFGSALRDKAILLNVLNMLDRKDYVFPLVKELAAALSSDEWMSTQTTSFALIAMQNYLETNSDEANISTLKWNLDGEKGEAEITPTETNVLKQKLDRPTNVVFENCGSKSIYLLVNKATQRTDVSTKAYSSGLKMKTMLLDENRYVVNDSLLHQGKDYILSIYVKNETTWDLEELALSIPMPSGVEILNRKDVIPEGITYHEVRDSEVYSYFNLDKNGTITVEVPFNATYEGVYKWADISVEAMYNHQIKANNDAKLISIQ